MQQLNHFVTTFRRPNNIYVGIVTTFILLVIVACNSNPPESVCTDICVDPLLEDFYVEHGGERLFGQPYTELLTDPQTGRQVQYFEGARLDVSANDSSTIEIANLGKWQYDGLDEPQQADIPLTNPHLEFPNGIILQDAFLEFYEAYGGEAVFGAPISNQLDEGDSRVQYFENFRLVWHPDAPIGLQIQVSETGRAHYMYEVYDPQQVVFIPNDEEQFTTAEVTAAVSSPILYGNDAQTIFVLAESTTLKPIRGLQVELTITHNGNTYTQTISTLTDPQGTTQATLDSTNWVPGESVQVDVSVSYPNGKSIGTTSITFQTWW
ncbi:MAG: hypothetical protein KDE51_10130 [Anaerolineales bacterium]|nr:hypothetical protein [Anaerolineales bacterium]